MADTNTASKALAANAPSRRHLIVGLGAAGGTMALGPAAGAAVDCPSEEVSDPALESQPFYGRHQAGVVTPQPAAGLIAAFDVLADNREDLEPLLRLSITHNSSPAGNSKFNAN
jgi:deferrochelatase/peroxidase EfeB